MNSPNIYKLKMQALMDLGWNSIIKIDSTHALLKLNSKDELNIDVATTPKNWLLRYQGTVLEWKDRSLSLPDKILKEVDKLISLYNEALQVILDEITDWRAFQ